VQPDEQIRPKERKRRRRAINLELFYYEQSGSRYHLRITPFAIILIFAALAFGFTILYLDGQKQSTPTPDVRIVPLSATLTSSPTEVQS
jgi:hypothetical protein